MFIGLGCPFYEVDIGAEFSPSNGNVYTLFSCADPSAIETELDNINPAQLYLERDVNINYLNKWSISNYHWYAIVFP
jgi:hypothetical protein